MVFYFGNRFVANNNDFPIWLLALLLITLFYFFTKNFLTVMFGFLQSIIPVYS